MRILGLDPAPKCIGWAPLDTEIDAVITYGAFKPTEKNFDAVLTECYWWLSDLVVDQCADVLAIEIPILATYQGKRNVKAFRTHAQLIGALRVAVYSWTNETIEILPSERLTALGLPVNMKSKPAKEQVLCLVNTMFDLDLTPDQHDIADAVAVALAAQRKLREREMMSDE